MSIKAFEQRLNKISDQYVFVIERAWNQIFVTVRFHMFDNCLLLFSIKKNDFSDDSSWNVLTGEADVNAFKKDDLDIYINALKLAKKFIAEKEQAK